MTGLLLGLVAAYGVHLLFTSFAFGWTGAGPGPSLGRHREVDLSAVKEQAAVVVVLALLGGAAGWILFGGVVAPLAAAVLAGAAPVFGARARAERRRAEAREAWPRLIEEIRIKAATLGRSLPQALLEVGHHAPDDLQPAFEAARREWLLSTDFEATLRVLKAGLADATADAVCETLLIAHQIGGNEVERCLEALHDDRVRDLQGRKDADARQAGARFARWFTLVVPLGMALVGLSIGDGRAAYGTAWGQTTVLVALALMAACWAWAGRIMKVPGERRVFGAARSGEA